MNVKEIEEKYIKMYRRQFDRIAKEISETIAKDTFYFESGSYRKTNMLALLSNIKDILESTKSIDGEFLEDIQEVYKLNVEETIKNYEQVTGQSVNLRKEWTKIDENDVKSISDSLIKEMTIARANYINQLERSMQAWSKASQNFIEKSSRQELENIVIGGQPKQVAIKGLQDKLRQYGLTSYNYRDKNNIVKRINLQSYASIQVNSKISFVVNNSVMNTGERLGEHRYKFSSHATLCPVCGVYAESGGVGRVYSKKKDDVYPWIGEIPNFLSYGQIHPNCKHRISLYFEEYAENAERDRKASNSSFTDNRSQAAKKRYNVMQTINRYKRENRENLQERKDIKSLGKNATKKEKRRLKKLEEISRKKKEYIKDENINFDKGTEL